MGSSHVMVSFAAPCDVRRPQHAGAKCFNPKPIGVERVADSSNSNCMRTCPTQLAHGHTELGHQPRDTHTAPPVDSAAP
eukprot:3494601-Amphidinium_carterae.1